MIRVFSIATISSFTFAGANAKWNGSEGYSRDKPIKNKISLFTSLQAVEKNAIFNYKTGNTDPGKPGLRIQIPEHSSLTKYQDILLSFSTINLSQPWKSPTGIYINTVTFPILYPRINFYAMNLAAIWQAGSCEDTRKRSSLVKDQQQNSDRPVISRSDIRPW